MRRNMPNPICFVGVDGAGKTTLAFSLIKQLRKSNLNCRYVWFRQPYFLSLPFLAFFRIFGLTRIYCNEGIPLWKEHNFNAKPARSVWTILQFFDVILSTLIKISLPKALGFVVVCDRYVQDIFVDIMVETGSDLSSSLLGRLLLATVSRSAAIFLLYVNEETARNRKKDIPSKEYLMVRQRLYSAMVGNISKYNLQQTLDGERDPIATCNHVVDCLIQRAQTHALSRVLHE